MELQDTIISSLDHYKALLLLYASHVDLDYSSEEREFIISAVGIEITEMVEAYFDSMSDFEVLAYLVEKRNMFLPGEEGRIQALELLSSLFNIDGDFSRLEYNSLQFLEKMFYSSPNGDGEL